MPCVESAGQICQASTLTACLTGAIEGGALHMNYITLNAAWKLNITIHCTLQKIYFFLILQRANYEWKVTVKKGCYQTTKKVSETIGKFLMSKLLKYVEKSTVNNPWAVKKNPRQNCTAVERNFSPFFCKCVFQQLNSAGCQWVHIPFKCGLKLLIQLLLYVFYTELFLQEKTTVCLTSAIERGALHIKLQWFLNLRYWSMGGET